MTKQEILNYFRGINNAYNDSTRFDSLSHMIDELLNGQEAPDLPKGQPEIVRCLDCVHWNPGPYTFCRVRKGVWTAGEYCSEGLRRADPRPDEEDKI